MLYDNKKETINQGYLELSLAHKDGFRLVCEDEVHDKVGIGNNVFTSEVIRPYC